MKKIIPYRNVEEALKALDNGGKFYSNTTKPNDGVINKAELESFGEGLREKKEIILLLQMHLSKLDEAQKTTLFSKLDEEVLKIYEDHKPQELYVEFASKMARPLSNAIITGVPKMLHFESNLDGYIMYPKMIGESKVMARTRLIERFHVYELEETDAPNTFLIAHPHGSEKLPERRMIIGGVIKEFMTNGSGMPKKMFLEGVYRCPA